jgi:hypothetical protein
MLLVSVEEDTYAAVYATTQRAKAIIYSERDLIVVILMVKNCIKSTITWYIIMDDCSGNVLERIN